VLRDAGLLVDSRPASDVTDVSAYAAVVLGSGVFLPRRQSDGGGFLVRHAADLGSRAVWLFCAGPIGRGRGSNPAGIAGRGDCSVADVGRAVGARGWALFGTPVVASDDDPMALLTPVDLHRVREWAREIAADVASGTASPAPPAGSPTRRAACHQRVVAAG
jgi:hypothetical protein